MNTYTTRLKRYKELLLIAAFVIGLTGCKQITEVTDLITNPTPREVYSREFKSDSVNFPLWEKAYNTALADSLEIDLPYIEAGVFHDFGDPIAYGYNFTLSEGELFYLDARVDSLKPRIFISLFLKLSDSLGPYKEVTQNQLNSRKLSYRVEQTGRYKVLIQPELHAFSGFALRAYSQPLYSFPVLGEDNGAIQSFWGAPRSGGTRDHKGIDIFTNRGTPVVAVAEGRIGFAGERGLGGKQVWLRTGLLGNSLYYAHLDSIVGTSGKRVQVGDTLGFVGNTGNARTTSPHLHFGIYRGYRGAIDPLPYVFNKEIPDFPESPETGIPQTVGVKTSKANLRIAASLEGNKIGEAVMHDTLSVLGKTGKWLRILNSDGLKAYIHGSLVVEISDEAI